MKLLNRIFRLAGLDKWAGINLVRGWVAYVMYRIFKPTNNAAVNSVVVALYIGVLQELSDEVGHYLDEGVAWFWSRTAQPIESATIGWIGMVSGVRPKNLSKEGLLDWAGIISAKQANAALGSKFKTFYPPAKMRDELELMVSGAVMNGGGFEGFQVMPAAEALALMGQVAASYNQQRGINVAAMQQKEIDQKRLNVIYQQTYRQTHPQIGVTLTPKSLIVMAGAGQALDEYTDLYAEELERRAAEKAAAEAAAAAAAGGAP